MSLEDLLKDWLRFGYDHASFWDQTARTLALTYKAQEAVAREDHNARVWLAWNTAALQKMQKRMPNLKSLLWLEKPKLRRFQSWQEQLEKIKRMVNAGQRDIPPEGGERA